MTESATTTTAEAPPAPRGPGRPALDRTSPLERDEIVARALQIVRADGLEALSMRRLAKDLGVTPMAIYHHVADKPALMNAVIEKVWLEIAAGFPQQVDDPIEFLVAVALRTRSAWLENIELAHLAVAVAEADETLFQTTMLSARIFEWAGFPDVPLAYSAFQTFTMGAVETAALRQTSSAYFGRDPKTVLAKARRLLTRRDASADHRGVIEARFDEGDDRYFEPALRALIAGLLLDEIRLP